MVNYRLKSGVTLHDELHGFRAGRVTGTATLEEKLAHQLAGIAHEPLFQIFLDARKAYESLDMGWCMEIMQGCGMGQSTERLIDHHWDNLIFDPKAKSFLGIPFGTEREVTEGYPV